MPKIPTHDVRRKDTAAFCLMEFNETSTIYLTVLLKSYVKVSEEEIVFWSKDTAHDVSKVLFYWGYSGSFLVEGDPFDEEGEPSSSKTRKGAKFVPRSSFSLAARNGLCDARNHRRLKQLGLAPSQPVDALSPSPPPARERSESSEYTPSDNESDGSDCRQAPAASHYFF